MGCSRCCRLYHVYVFFQNLISEFNATSFQAGAGLVEVKLKNRACHPERS